MGKKRRMLSSAKYKAKRSTLWEAMNATAELSAKVDEVVEKVEALTAPPPKPVAEVAEVIETATLTQTLKPKATKPKATTRKARTTRKATKKTSKLEN